MTTRQKVAEIQRELGYCILAYVEDVHFVYFSIEDGPHPFIVIGEATQEEWEYQSKRWFPEYTGHTPRNLKRCIIPAAFMPDQGIQLLKDNSIFPTTHIQEEENTMEGLSL